MNCLTYILDLIDEGYDLKVLYDSNHVVGVDQDNLIHDFDINMRGDIFTYLPVEQYHTKEVIKKIFDLDERYSKIIDNYYAS